MSARGATPILPKVPISNVSFNPRPREGSDSFSKVLSLSPSSFNPRPREGSD